MIYSFLKKLIKYYFDKFINWLRIKKFNLELDNDIKKYHEQYDKKVKKIELCTLRMHTKSCTLNFRYYYILCLSTGYRSNKNS